MEHNSGDELLVRDDHFTAECLYLSRLFFKIRDRKERRRIIALAESTIKLQASRATNPDAPAR